jgi:hypothetical protein
MAHAESRKEIVPMKIGKLHSGVLLGSLLAGLALTGMMTAQSGDSELELFNIYKLVKQQIHLRKEHHRDPQQIILKESQLAQAVIEQEKKLITAVTSSPIKVRGGAMTFRAAEWSTDASHKDCIQGDNSYVELIDIVPWNHPIAQATRVVIPTLALTWQMDLFGRTSAGKPQMTQGVRLTPTASCGGQPGIVWGSESGSTDWYPTNDETGGAGNKEEDGSTYIRRYRYSTCASAAGDEDLCEHLSYILINKTPKANPTPLNSDYAFLCQNGECEIGIGNPYPPPLPQ